MAERDDQRDVASPGYQNASPGYQDQEDAPSSDSERIAGATKWDPDLHLNPEEAKAHLNVPRGVPVAGPGMAGMAIERRTGKAVHVGGRVQWDVLAEPLIGSDGRSRQRAVRAADGTADGLAADGLALADEAKAARVGRRPWQVNVRLNDEEIGRVDRAAGKCGVPRTTLARVLLLRGSEAILADSQD